MKHLQKIKNNKQNKYDEITQYLKQDNGYWLDNDKWDSTKEFFIGKKIRRNRYFNFERIDNVYLKNEVKYYFLYNFKNGLLKLNTMDRQSESLKNLSEFINKFLMNKQSFSLLCTENTHNQWKLFLINIGIKITNVHMSNITNFLIDFIKDFYDDREETEKDIWHSKNIKGAKIPASGSNHSKYKSISFVEIPEYYRDTVKRYFKLFITKRSWSHLNNLSGKLRYFFDFYYKNGYSNGFLENLTREDIEKYIYFVNNDLAHRSSNYKYQFVDYIRSFLEYIQMAQYSTAPKKEVAFLIFKVNTETHELKEVDLSSDDGENLIRYEYVKKNLDAVRVPFGVCFKPSKLPCKQQMNFCLTCASFCTTVENIPEYEEEIDKVKEQKILHKNGKSREVV